MAVAVTAAPKGKDSSNDSQKILETSSNLAQTNTDLNATHNVETENLSLAMVDTNAQLEIPQPDVIAVETPSKDNNDAIGETETTALKSNPAQQESSLDQEDDTREKQGEQEEYFDVQPLVIDTKQTDVSSVSSEDNEPASDESTTVAPDLKSDNDGNNAETENALEKTAKDNLETNSSSTATQNEHQQPQSTTSEQENAQQTQDEVRSLGEIPMRDEYFGLRRIEAVQKLLEKHSGNICHVDFVMLALYPSSVTFRNKQVVNN